MRLHKVFEPVRLKGTVMLHSTLKTDQNRAVNSVQKLTHQTIKNYHHLISPQQTKIYKVKATLNVIIVKQDSIIRKDMTFNAVLVGWMNGLDEWSGQLFSILISTYCDKVVRGKAPRTVWKGESFSSCFQGTVHKLCRLKIRQFLTPPGPPVPPSLRYVANRLWEYPPSPYRDNIVYGRPLGGLMIVDGKVKVGN